MFTNVKIGDISFLVDFEMAEKLQDEFDSLLVMANFVGYKIVKTEVTKFVFINVISEEKSAITIRIELNKNRTVRLMDVYTFGYKVEEMKLKHKVKNGEMTFTKNFVKAVRVAGSLL